MLSFLMCIGWFGHVAESRSEDSFPSKIVRLQHNPLQFSLVQTSAKPSVVPSNSTNWDNHQLTAALYKEESIARFMTYYRHDSELDVEHVLARQWLFQSVQRDVLNYGFNSHFYWFQFTVRNTSSEKGQWLLTTGMRAPPLLELYEVKESSAQRVFNFRYNFDFEQRPVKHRFLHIPIALEANQEKTFLLHVYNPIGFRLFPKIISWESYQDYFSLDSLLIGVFIATIAVLLIVNFSQYLATFRSLYLHYCHMILWSAFSVFQHGGLNYQWLWPNSVSLDFMVTKLIAVPLSISLLQVFRVAMNFKNNAYVIDRAVLVLMAFMAASVPLYFVFEGSRIFQYTIYAITPLSFIVLIICSIISVRKKIESAFLYIAGWSCLIIGTAVFTLMHSGYPIFTTVYNSLYFYAGGVLLEGVILSLALAHQIKLLHKSHAKNRRLTIAMLKDRIGDMELIKKLDREREQAVAETKKNSLQIASASHDIFQPLFAIRNTLAAEGKKVARTEACQSIYDALDQAEAILKSSIHGSKAIVLRDNDHVSVTRLFNQLFKQNYQQAKMHNVKLKFSLCSLYFPGSKLILLRILDNLLKNALRVSVGGKVLCGVRRRAFGIELQVLDNGPGIDSKYLDRLRSPYMQSHNEENNGNYGLGLSIIDMLCEQQNYELSVKTTKGRGSAFSIKIKCA